MMTHNTLNPRQFFFGKLSLKIFLIFALCLGLVFMIFALSIFLLLVPILGAITIIGSFGLANFVVMWSFIKSRNMLMPCALYLSYNLIEYFMSYWLYGNDVIFGLVINSIFQGMLGVGIMSIILLKRKSVMFSNNRKIEYIAITASTIVITLLMTITEIPNGVTL